MKKWMATFAAAAVVCAVAPQIDASETIVQDGVHYEIFTAATGNKEARIIGRDRQQTTVSLPDTINGVRVTEIADFAFLYSVSTPDESWDEPTTVLKLPAHVKKIGDHAFRMATFPNGIVIPASVEVIEDQAFLFANTPSFTLLTVPKTTGLHNLYVSESAQIPAVLTHEKVTILTENPNFQLTLTGGDVAKRYEQVFYETFTHNGEQQVRITGVDPLSPNTAITIPEKINNMPVTEIADYAFSGNNVVSLKSWTDAQKVVTLPQTIRKIGVSAFQANNLVFDITTLPNLEEVGAYAFTPKKYADNRIYNSKPFVLPATLHTIGEGAFSKTDITDVQIRKENERLGEAAFENSQLTHVTIDEGVTAIPKHAFSQNALTAVDLPTTVTAIAEGAFSHNKLQSVTLPPKLTTIGASAFAYNELKALTIPEAVTTIGNDAFSQNALTSIDIPKNVTMIRDRVFAHNELSTFNIPNHVTSIGIEAFAHNQLTELLIPEQLTTIGDGAFSYNALSQLHVPANITTIENDAFAYNKLEDVTIDKATTINEGAFMGNRIHTLKLPDELTVIGKEAFHKNNLKRLVLPHRVQQVGHHAFLNNDIASVHVPASLKQLDLTSFYSNPLSYVVLQGSHTIVKNTTNFVNKQGAKFKGVYIDETYTTPYANFNTTNPNGKPMTLYVAFDDTIIPAPNKPTPSVAKFKDIAGHWAQGAIESFTDKGYINGYPDGTFKPGAPIQRKHVARILNDVFKFEAVKQVADFTDVPKNHPYYAAISAVQQAGIFSGDGGKFQPEANLTRGQLAKVLVLAAGFEPGGKSTFKDTPASYWGTPYVSALADLAIVKGTDGFFNPQKPITRAQFVSMTSLALEEMARRAK